MPATLIVGQPGLTCAFPKCLAYCPNGHKFCSIGQGERMVEPASVADIMGGEKVLRQRVRTPADLEAAVSRGLPLRALEETAKRISGRWASASALQDRLVPRATRARRTRLKPSESEKVERLARMMALAEAVWEDEEDARGFMNEPHPLLEERAPVEVAQT